MRPPPCWMEGKTPSLQPITNKPFMSFTFDLFMSPTRTWSKVVGIMPSFNEEKPASSIRLKLAMLTLWLPKISTSWSRTSITIFQICAFSSTWSSIPALLRSSIQASSFSFSLISSRNWYRAFTIPSTVFFPFRFLASLLKGPIKASLKAFRSSRG